MFVQELIYPCGTAVLVWQLIEDGPQLLALSREKGIPVDDLMDLPVKRQREKSVERLLLCRAFGHGVSLLHDEQGAPLIQGHEGVNISITHTPQLVALAWHGQHVIGLDAEQCDRGQVLRVRDRFLNTDEQQFIDPGDLDAHVIAWTVKEAIIKAERNSAINWTDGICLEPFDWHADDIVVVARCGGHGYSLSSRLVQGHYITVASPQDE